MLLQMLRRLADSTRKSPAKGKAQPQRFRPRLEGLEVREVPAVIAPPMVQVAAAQPAAQQVVVQQARQAVANRQFAAYKESLEHLWQIVKLTRNAVQAPWVSLDFGKGRDGTALANVGKIQRLAMAGQIFNNCMEARELIVQAREKFDQARFIGGEEQRRLVAEGNALLEQAGNLAFPAERDWYALWNTLHARGWQALARMDVEWVRENFGQWPNLRNYRILGPGTGIPAIQLENNRLISTPGQYNCFAWSIGSTNHYFFPDNYASMHRFYRGHGFTAYASPRSPLRNPRLFTNVAVYGYLNPETGQMVYTHAARQLPNGTWTSKLGNMGLIGHNRPQDVAGGRWGQVVAYYWKRR